MPYLLIKGADGSSQEKADVTWEAPFRIGSHPSNDLLIAHPRISPHHVQIRFSSGKFWLEDLESAHGTAVNGIKIRTKMLQDGSDLCLGPPDDDEADIPANHGVDCQFLALVTDPSPAPEGASETGETVLDINFDMDDDDDMGLLSGETCLDKVFPTFIQVDDTGQEIEKHLIDSNVTSIGRSKSNRIVLNNRTASRHHCEIVNRDRAYYINDLDSANGVSVNGNKIKKERITNGDTIQIGYLEFKFCVPGDSGADDGDTPAVQRKSLSELEVLETTASEESGNPFPWVLVIAMGGLIAAMIILILMSTMS